MTKLVSVLLLVLSMAQSAYAASACFNDASRLQELQRYEEGFYELQSGLHGSAVVSPALWSMVKRLQAASQQLAGMNLRVLGTGDPDIAAFAGNSMVVLSAGLLSPVHELTDGEIAAVIAHELAHVEAQHTRYWACRVVQQFGAPSGTLGEAVKAFMSAMVDSPDELFPAVLKEKHANEFYADKRGMELLQAAGFEPEAMVTFMFKRHHVALEHGTELQATTHPTLLSRALAAQSALAERAGTGANEAR